MTPESFIASIVEQFYQKATVDVLIGYHFRHIKDCSTHLPRINAFWELQLFGKTSIPIDSPLDAIRAHVPLKIHRGEVGRWMKLFKQTLDENKKNDEHELIPLWEKKLIHFEQIFLQNSLLFPKA